MVKHTSTDPESEGLNPAASRYKEKMVIEECDNELTITISLQTFGYSILIPAKDNDEDKVEK